MKFYSLFKKELKDMFNMQTILTTVGIVVLLMVVGNIFSNSVSESAKKSGDVVICDMDNTEFTKSVIAELKKMTEDNDGTLTEVEIKSDNYSKELKRIDQKQVIIIPEGFTDLVSQHKTAKITFVQRMTSLAMMSNLNTGSANTFETFSAAVKSTIYAQKLLENKISEEEIKQLEDPVELEEMTVIGSKQEEISSSLIMSICTSQNMVVPIILFVLIMFASQMILNAISTEKIDKTLETLLSAPVSRISVLAAKTLSAALVAGVQAAAFMFGTSQMMSGMTGGLGLDEDTYTKALENLGLTLSLPQYILVGVQMFLSILIALCAALILGVLAKDAKSAQTLLMPITISTMIPYFLSMMADITSLPLVLKCIVYAIPFSHTFMATENIMFANIPLYIGGVIYQLIFLAVCMKIALSIFMSDKIFTMSLGEKKTKTKKAK
ncbi:MAG: ABC transporter permease [Ruminococcus sp.]|nr:ABC transporter permease [Ruminococcus sp.]